MRRRVIAGGLMLALLVAMSLVLAAQAMAAPLLCDSLDAANLTGVHRFYVDPGWPKWAQSFTANATGTIDSAVFALDRDIYLGPSAGYACAELYNVSGGRPTGAPLATSAPIDMSALPVGRGNPQLVTFQFANEVSLVRGAQYAIAVSFVLPSGVNGTMEVGRCDNPAAHPGSTSGFWTYWGPPGSWQSESQSDLIFYVYVNPPRWVVVQPPKISDDLVAQTDSIAIPALVKIHPTLQLAIDKESLYYDNLNPATNASCDLTFTVQVKSNLPFKKQITMEPFTFTESGTKPDGTPIDVLQSWDYVNGAWSLQPWPVGVAAPGTGDVIGMAQQSVYITEVNGRTGALVRDEELVGEDGVYPGDGTSIGNIDEHVFEDQVRWHVGPIRWSNTAGYYKGQLSVTVYQN